MSKDQQSGSSSTLIGIVAVVIILAGAWFFVVSPMMNSNQAWNVQMSDDGHYEVTVTPSLDPIQLNETHEWVVKIRHEDGSPLEGADISISGGMPAHGHGFNNQPQFTESLGNGEYKIEGMQFHMPGDWVVEVGFSIDDHQHTVEYEFRVEPTS